MNAAKEVAEAKPNGAGAGNGGGLAHAMKDIAENKPAGGNGGNGAGAALASALKNKQGQAVGGGPKGSSALDNKQFSALKASPGSFFSGASRDNFGNLWTNGLLTANLVVDSVAIAGYWSGGCVGCGQFWYNNGGSSCPYCEFFFIFSKPFFIFFGLSWSFFFSLPRDTHRFLPPPPLSFFFFYLRNRHVLQRKQLRLHGHLPRVGREPAVRQRQLLHVLLYVNTFFFFLKNVFSLMSTADADDKSLITHPVFLFRFPLKATTKTKIRLRSDLRLLHPSSQLLEQEENIDWRGALRLSRV